MVAASAGGHPQLQPVTSLILLQISKPPDLVRWEAYYLIRI